MSAPVQTVGKDRTNSGNGTTTTVLTVLGATTAGHTITVHSSTRSSGNNCTGATDSQGNTYVRVGPSFVSANSGEIIDIFVCTSPVALSTSDTITVAYAGSGNARAALAIEWAGTFSVPATPINTGDVASVTTSPPVVQVTPDNASAIVVGTLAMFSSSVAPTVASPFTLWDTQANTSGSTQEVSVAYRQESSTAADGPAWTTPSQKSASFTFTLDPSGGGTTVPDAPTSVGAVAGNAQAAVSWTAPASNGGSAITDYQVQYSSNGGTSWTTFADGTSTATSATVTGLTNGTAYTFRVAAINSVGTGSFSSASAAVTPVGQINHTGQRGALSLSGARLGVQQVNSTTVVRPAAQRGATSLSAARMGQLSVEYLGTQSFSITDSRLGALKTATLTIELTGQRGATSLSTARLGVHEVDTIGHVRHAGERGATSISDSRVGSLVTNNVFETGQRGATSISTARVGELFVSNNSTGEATIRVGPLAQVTIREAD